MPDADQYDDADRAVSMLRRRAAIWLWFLGGIEMVISLSLLAQVPQLKPLAAEDVAEMMGTAAVDSRLTGPAMATALSIVACLFGLIPAASFLISAFFIRAGRLPAMWVALIGLYGQLAIVGFYLLASTAWALQQGNPVGLTMVVLVFGTAAAALYHGAKTVHLAQRATREIEDIASDPWRSDG